MTQVHAYTRDQQTGQIEHGLTAAEDLGGAKSVTGETLPLVGRPTPAMRRGVDGLGNEMPWFLGTDSAGRLAPVY